MRHNDSMLKTLLQRLTGQAAISIPDELWHATLASLPFVARLDERERARLRALAEQLLAVKQMSGAAGLELTAEIQINIAVQACLPVLNLGLGWYRGWKEIIVYPTEFLVPRQETDDAGVVHEYVEPITGEAWERGPLLLSWEDAQQSATDSGAAYSVVIHEFTHKIDLLNGEADGVPPLSADHKQLTVEQWRRVLTDSFNRFVAEVELIESELPVVDDDEDHNFDRFFAHLPFDSYAAHDEAEFFAVTSEAFFVDPHRLQQAFAEWYALLAQFFLQDPLKT